MTLTAGTSVGPYEIVSAIGAGGMGEVYRARDSRLQRDVAIKVLPELLSIDQDMLARFAREAQVLAQLNHPNIAAVYGVEDTAGGPGHASARALVMELVDGPTLADAIAAASRQAPLTGSGQHRGLPLAEAIDIARQIALAMEAAHDQGIVHRDLKPANVKLRPDGTVKVLDFGLAKAFEPAAPISASVAHSPTLSLRATQAGLILGTAGYMSPEQAKGKPVDRRADIWAFGVVLFEMLTGRVLYTGETVSEILARVIERDPDLQALPADTPRRLRDLLRRCLVKDPRTRLRDIGEARVVLEEIAAKPEEGDAPAPASAAAAAPRPAAWRRALPWSTAAAALLIAGVAVWAPWRGTPPDLAPIRVVTDLGAAGTLTIYAPIALSPDGSVLAFVLADTAASSQGLIHVRRLDQIHAVPLAGTTGARSPFFSPDGAWIAFFADRKLKKISVNGGAPVTLCDAPLDRGGAWSEDDTIVFAPNSRGPLSRVRAAGGKPEPFSTLDAARGEITHRFPHIVPGADLVLYVAHTAGNNFEESDIVAQRLSDGVRQTVRRGALGAVYFSSGHLGFVQGGTLFAEPFDLRSLKTTGDAFPVQEGIRTSTTSGFTALAVSSGGTVAYVQGGSDEGGVLLSAVTAGGRQQSIRPATVNANTVAIAPDGQRVALDLANGSDYDVWIHEPARDVLTRLTSAAEDETKPLWSADGTRIAYAVSSTRDGTYAIDWRRADSSGDAQRLLENTNRVYPSSWHPSGKFLAYVEQTASGGVIRILSMEGSEAAGWKPGTSSAFVTTSGSQQEPAFSPDGQWLAYMSNHSSRWEAYVRPFPGPGAQVQISTAGGFVPRWSRRVRELYFLSSPEQIPMAARYAIVDGMLRPERPRVWADVRVAQRSSNRPYDVHPDGERLLMLDLPVSKTVAPDRITLLFNGLEEIRRKAPRK